MGTRVIRGNKHHIGIIIIVGCLLIACTFGGFLYYREITTPRLVQFSIDDATPILQDITVNQYDSIFDNPILNVVKGLHDNYNITVTLYVYELFNGFSIDDMTVQYRDEFISNSDWLKIGYHCNTENNPADGLFEKEFEQSYERTERAIWRFAGNDTIAHVLRLHYWYADDAMINFLISKGITGLLCSDKKEICYNLSEEQAEKLYHSRDGKIVLNKLIYYETDLRVEDIENVEKVIEEHKNDHIITIFTHEWCFMENKEKLYELVSYLTDKNYVFCNLEVTD